MKSYLFGLVTGLVLAGSVAGAQFWDSFGAQQVPIDPYSYQLLQQQRALNATMQDYLNRQMMNPCGR